MKIVNVYKLLTIFAKRSILDDWQGSEYASYNDMMVVIEMIIADFVVWIYWNNQ